jgi:transglutaminase-like putative cysteine protease
VSASDGDNLRTGGEACKEDDTMMRDSRVATLISLLAAVSVAWAGDVRYPVRDIPPGLRGDADAVIRENSTVFEVRDHRRASLTRTIAVTIFNANGRDHGELSLSYDRFHSIRGLEGWIYDEQGALVRELEDADVHDFSDIDGYALFEDSRARTAELYHDRYPYTVLYTYREDYDGYLNWPHWAAQWEKDPVQQTTFEIQVPVHGTLRYWTNADTVKPDVSVDGDTRIVRWSARNLAGLEPEMMEEDIDRRTLNVLLAPAEFQIGDYHGNMSSWKEFGLWNAEVWAGRDMLPGPAVNDVRALLHPGETPRESIGALYRYMQSRTRYVSVQLGIGGWQPFDAAYVHERGYGDCKALSNYMVSLLKQAGLTAYPVLIYSGPGSRLYRKDFPSNQFNHVIVCVPLAKDTVWLECTSQYMPPGHLGWSTENRFGLMITPSGGEPVRTPASTPERNVQRRTGVVGLAAGGAAQAAIDVSYTGDRCDRIREELVRTPVGERDKWLINHMQVQNAALRKSRVQGLEDRDSSVSISTVIALPDYGSVTGTRCFFEPNMLERITGVPREMPARRSPVRFDYPHLVIDSIAYRYSRVYRCEAMPKEVHLESPVGSFRSKTVCRDDSTIVYTRTLEIRGTEFAPSAYGEYRRFMAAIVVADRGQVVLVRKNP